MDRGIERQMLSMTVVGPSFFLQTILRKGVRDLEKSQHIKEHLQWQAPEAPDL